MLFCFAPDFNYVRYSDRFLPDKAIDLIDEAGSRVRLRHAQVLFSYQSYGFLRPSVL